MESKNFVISKINKKMLKLSLIFNSDSNSSVYDYDPDQYPSSLIYKSIGLEFNIIKRKSIKDYTEEQLNDLLENLKQIELNI